MIHASEAVATFRQKQLQHKFFQSLLCACFECWPQKMGALNLTAKSGKIVRYLISNLLLTNPLFTLVNLWSKQISLRAPAYG